MFCESSGRGGMQDREVGLPAPRRPPLSLTFAGGTSVPQLEPETVNLARLIFENSTVCHLVDELVCYALIDFGLGCFFRQ